MRIIVSFLLLATFFLSSISAFAKPATKMSAQDPDLARKIRRFAPTVLTANTARLSPGDRRALTENHRGRQAARSIIPAPGLEWK